MVLPGGWGVPAGTAPRMLRDAKVPANINPKNTYGSPFFPTKQDAVGLDTVSGEQSWGRGKCNHAPREIRQHLCASGRLKAKLEVMPLSAGGR